MEAEGVEIILCDYRYYLPQMRARRSHAQQWTGQHEQLVKRVPDRIRVEGPLASADFKAPDGFERGAWWSRKPARQALEMLLTSSDLMVAERRNFQHVYDLRERVLPDWVDTTEPSPGEVAQFQVRRVLAALGVASGSEIQWKRGNREAVSRALEELADSGEIMPVEVDGWKERPCYALAEVLD